MRRIAIATIVSIVAACGVWACGGGSTTAPATSAQTPTLTSVTVGGVAPSIGSSNAFTATAMFSDNSTKSVTSVATWDSTNPLVVTVSSTGLVTGVGAGAADIGATYQGIRGLLHVTLTAPVAPPPPTLTSVSVSGTPPAIAGSSQFTATAMFSDNNMQVVTNQATWDSTNALVASVSASGLVIGLAAGSTDIGATYHGVRGVAHLTLTAPAPTLTCNGAPVPSIVNCLNNQGSQPPTAQCKDGAFSCSQSRRGTCSSHGGVSCWVCPGPLC